MAEPFKTFLNAALVEHAAQCLQRVDPSFQAAAMGERIVPHLDALELKARANLIAEVLDDLLPADFDRAAEIVERALAPVSDAATSHPAAHADGLRGWILWPFGEVAARRGIQHPARAMKLLHALTQRYTAEFAIRPLIEAHAEMIYPLLLHWTADPSEHVRRLVSEGTRPRLPWGLQLKAVVKDPTPSWPLLAALLDDPSEYVRRSVANHLNDIAKDHPELVVDWLERYLPDANTERRALLRHACRTLIKQGHPRTLRAWGIGTPLIGQAKILVVPAAVRIGESLQLSVTLNSAQAAPQRLAVDYVVHHVRSSGRRSPKVFKGWTLELAAHETRTLSKRHSFRVITTRTYFPGPHSVDVQVNGHVVATATFELCE